MIVSGVKSRNSKPQSVAWGQRCCLYGVWDYVPLMYLYIVRGEVPHLWCFGLFDFWD